MDLMKETNIFYNVFCFLITENEKFVDKSFSKLYWRTVYHSLVMLHHVYVGLFAMGLDLESFDDIEIRTLKKYRVGFLTGWNFMFQTTFLFISVVYDTLEWLEKHEGRIGQRIKYWRDIIFSSLVVPITLFVTGMFWSVYAIDRELVFPQVYDQIVPWWFNHCVHTNITIVIAIETILVARRYPVNEKLETLMVAGVTVLYAIVYYSIYFLAHRWLYGVFGVMTWWQVVLFQCMIWASSYIFYRIQFPINRLIHGRGAVAEVESEDHGIKTLGRMNKNGQGCAKNGAVADDEENNGDDKINSRVEGKDLSDKEDGLTVSVNGVEVSGNGKLYDDVTYVGENGEDQKNELDGLKVVEGMIRNSNSPIFANKPWSKQYDRRSPFEKTKL